MFALLDQGPRDPGQSCGPILSVRNVKDGAKARLPSLSDDVISDLLVHTRLRSSAVSRKSCRRFLPVSPRLHSPFFVVCLFFLSFFSD